MIVSVFNRWNKFQVGILFVSLVLVFSTYVVLETIFKGASNELIRTWYSAELVNIQQGNLLSSVSKLQRSIEENSILKGIQITDYTQRTYLTIGEVWTLNSNLTGYFFEREVTVSVKDFKISFLVRSVPLRYVFLGFATYCVVICSSFFVLVKRYAEKEERLKNEIRLASVTSSLIANREISRIATQLAHDIRSPLSVVNSISYRIKNEYAEESGILSEVSKQILMIANDLLAKNRELKSEQIGQTTQLEIYDKEISSIDLVKIVDQAVQLKSVEARDRIEFRLRSDALRSRSFVGNELELKRVLSNLLTNSMEALNGKGTIQVEVRNKKSDVEIEIVDDGPGIPAAIAKCVYERPTTFGKENGNGYGLFSSIKILESWGGALTLVESVPRGTKVSLTIKALPSL